MTGISSGRAEAGYALPPGAAVDEFGRLKTWPGKQQVPCPPMDDKTAVLLILGQSNAANHGGQRLKSKFGPEVINFHAGLCFAAESPLLGATGQGGEPWTAVANLLIESGTVTHVILVPVAVSGSRIARWVPGGDLHGVLVSALASVRLFYTPTQVLWLQGESDFALQTPAAVYGTGLVALVKSLRSARVLAPVYVAVASKCAGKPVWNAANDVAAAQRASVNVELGIFRGPDLDGTLGDEDRYDGCHLSGHGLMKTAQAWVAAIERHRN